MKILKSSWVFWFFGLPVVLVLVVLTVFGSRILINPTKVEITPCGDAVMFRHYPMVDWFGFDYPIVKYVTTVTGFSEGTNGGYPCSESNKWRYNHDLKRGFNRWTINHYAQECMKDSVGFTFESTFTAYLFDAIPLRPTTITATVVMRGTEWELCRFRSPS